MCEACVCDVCGACMEVYDVLVCESVGMDMLSHVCGSQGLVFRSLVLSFPLDEASLSFPLCGPLQASW